ncbi:hypothetical protein J6590_000162 [Homalodisca vitripennis]|nr:hypothetical protein J6590_000162 [Homalodisca vitripennis]
MPGYSIGGKAVVKWLQPQLSLVLATSEGPRPADFEKLARISSFLGGARVGRYRGQDGQNQFHPLVWPSPSLDQVLRCALPRHSTPLPPRPPLPNVVSLSFMQLVST